MWPGLAPFTARLDSAIRAGKVPPMLVVFPNGLPNSMWSDSKDGRVPMETIVAGELLPHIDATFRTIASREGRLVEGFSMGGYGAARLGFKFPNLFGSVSILGGGPLQEEFNVNEAPRASPREAQARLDTVYGGDQAYFRAQSPWLLAEQNADAVRRMRRIRQVVGERDNVLDNNRKFDARLSALNIPHTFVVLSDASHNLKEVLDALGEGYWEFYREALGPAGRRGVRPGMERQVGDTLRWVIVAAGQPVGQRLAWRNAPDEWTVVYEYRGSRQISTVAFDAEGMPLRMTITSGAPAAEERFERRASMVSWSTPVDSGKASTNGVAYYVAKDPDTQDPGALVRALLRRPGRTLALLPAGEARLEALGDLVVEADGRRRTIRHYAIHGLDLMPTYVWLDEDGTAFADEVSVRSGWEATFPTLRRSKNEALGRHMRRMAEGLVPPARERPLVIRNARLFDPATKSVRAATTVVIEGNRIAALGGDGAVNLPAAAEVIDAAGRMVLPGLWDMHAHHSLPLLRLEPDAPLHLAAGVTTARDLGSDTAELASLRRRIEAGEAVGPRILAAGLIEGTGGRPLEVQLTNVEEARTAVDRFAAAGYVQIKIYGALPAELVPVVIERARQHGLRVSGHIPWAIDSWQAVEGGFDEVQHLDFLMKGAVSSVADAGPRWRDWGWVADLAELSTESEVVRRLIGRLAERGVAVDPTLAAFFTFFQAEDVPPTWFSKVMDRFPAQARRRELPAARTSRSPRVPEMVRNMFGVVRALHEAGVPILSGSDRTAGFTLHRELELFVEAGIPASQVLTLATLGAARDG